MRITWGELYYQTIYIFRVGYSYELALMMQYVVTISFKFDNVVSMTISQDARLSLLVFFVSLLVVSM